MLEVGLVDKLERDRNLAFSAAHLPVASGEALVAQVGSLVEGEFEADRIDRDDGREQRRVAAIAAGHQIADGDAAVADASVDRRAQLGIFVEVELGLMDHRLLRGDGGLRHALGLLALVVGLLGDGLVVHQFLAAREIGLGEGEIGARLREIGAHLVERDLKRPVVDDEQEIALLHHLPVGEMDLGQVSGHARAHLDRVDGDEAADIFVLIDDRALHRLRHRHRRRRRAAGLLLAPLTAPGEGQQRRDDQDGSRPAWPALIKRAARCTGFVKAAARGAALIEGAARGAASAMTMRPPQSVLWRPHHMRLPLSTAAEIVALPGP